MRRSKPPSRSRFPPVARISCRIPSLHTTCRTTGISTRAWRWITACAWNRRRSRKAIGVAPRAGFAWTPFERLGTTFRAGFGFFYDHVPLNVYAFNHYPKETVTYFDPSGNITAGPYFYGNALGEVDVRIPFVFRKQGPGNFSPQTATGNIQVEQPLTRSVKVRASYIHSQSAGLVIMDQTLDPVSQIGANQLIGSGDARYQQFELTTRARLGEKRRAVLLVHPQHGARRPERFQQLPGQLPDSHRPAESIRQSAGRPAESISGMGRAAIAAQDSRGAGVRSAQRLPVFLHGCSSELRRRAQPESLSRSTWQWIRACQRTSRSIRNTLSGCR